MIDYKPLTQDNFKDFLHLIVNKRGGAEESFYRWKYIDSPIQTFPWGFIAYHDGLPCGCIGCLSKVYVDDNGRQHPATWFADWYVDPELRGHKIGITLLGKILALSPYAFGITNPKPAQMIAKKVGYKVISDCLLSKCKLKPVLAKNTKFQYKIKLLVKDIIKTMIIRPIKGLQTRINEVTTGGGIGQELLGFSVNGTFHKDDAYYDWLMNMPGANMRKWYVCQAGEIRLLISVDYRNKNDVYMRVYHSTFTPMGNNQHLRYLRTLATIGRQLRVNGFETFDYIPGIKYNYRFSILTKMQPMQYNSALINFTFQKLSIADKESSWKQL